MFSARKGVPAHSVDIREAVGGGDGAVVVGIVHHRGEEIGGQHQRALLVQLPDGGIVRRAQAHQQVGVIGRPVNILEGAQHLRQRFRV